MFFAMDGIVNIVVGVVSGCVGVIVVVVVGDHFLVEDL